MAAGSTYTPIATTTVAVAAANVTFSSIPSTYTDLVLIITATNTSGNTDLFLNVNSDTGTNYSYSILWGDGTTVGSNRYANQTRVRLGFYGLPQSTVNYNSITHIQNYANTTTNKTWLTRSNAASAGTDAIVGLWRNTAAINRLDITANGVTVFGTGSTFTLYGIKAA